MNWSMYGNPICHFVVYLDPCDLAPKEAEVIPSSRERLSQSNAERNTYEARQNLVAY